MYLLVEGWPLNVVALHVRVAGGGDPGHAQSGYIGILLYCLKV
jgi:hypothetical protein